MGKSRNKSRIAGMLRQIAAKYRKLPLWERCFDGFLVFAVTMGAFLAIFSSKFNFSQETILLLHKLDIMIFFVFMIDVIRTYFKVQHPRLWLKAVWLDTIILVIGFVATTYMLYAAVSRLMYLVEVGNLHKVTQFYHFGAISKKFR